MGGHTEIYAAIGYVHTVVWVGAYVHDLDEITKPIYGDDEVVYTDAGIRALMISPREHR